MKYTVNRTWILSKKKNMVLFGVSCGKIRASGLSADERSVKELADLCNMLKLSDIQLCDVAEDFIEEQSWAHRAAGEDSRAAAKREKEKHGAFCGR